MTFGEAVMEAIAAWDEFQANEGESYDELAESMERLREKAALTIDTVVNTFGGSSK